MEERSGVLIQNEKHANKSVANHKPIFGFAGAKINISLGGYAMSKSMENILILT